MAILPTQIDHPNLEKTLMKQEQSQLIKTCFPLTTLSSPIS